MTGTPTACPPSSRGSAAGRLCLLAWLSPRGLLARLSARGPLAWLRRWGRLDGEHVPGRQAEEVRDHAGHHARGTQPGESRVAPGGRRDLVLDGRSLERLAARTAVVR